MGDDNKAKAADLFAKTAGQYAYEFYCKETGGKSLVSGAHLPDWNNLKPAIRNAWEQAATGVTVYLVRNGWQGP